MTLHTYSTAVRWEGSTCDGYRQYSRAHAVTAAPATAMLDLSAAAAFRGDQTRLNPEQLLVAAVSSCQLLSFLAVAAHHGVDVRGYADNAEGVMDAAQLPTRISRILLRPVVQVSLGTNHDEVVRLARMAHEGCYISNSVNSTIELDVTVVDS